MGVGSVLEIVMGALFTAAMGIFVFRVAKATDEEKRHCRFTAAAFAAGSAFGVAAEWLAGDGCAAAMLYALCFMLAYTAFVFSFPEKGKPHEGA